ncbi:hypothetical protein F4808DRAFT_245990 [Astrocystis sublimbata]|nr:hypothetical protein F4808DRAFT_245990 [Astrocystis sublimbata]
MYKASYTSRSVWRALLSSVGSRTLQRPLGEAALVLGVGCRGLGTTLRVTPKQSARLINPVLGVDTRCDCFLAVKYRKLAVSEVCQCYPLWNVTLNFMGQLINYSGMVMTVGMQSHIFAARLCNEIERDLMFQGSINICVQDFWGPVGNDCISPLSEYVCCG